MMMMMMMMKSRHHLDVIVDEIDQVMETLIEVQGIEIENEMVI